MEALWAGALERGETVHVEIKPIYSPGDDIRPASFQVAYQIDGRQFFRFFENVSGGKR